MPVLVGALLFALMAYAGLLLADRIARMVEPFDDGPQPGEPPLWLLVLGCSLVGAAVTAHAASGLHLAVVATVCTCLAAAWYVDARCGIVPDVFSIGPLLLVLGVAMGEHHSGVFVSALIPLAPFATAAALSRGRGMGWGDVKLAALAGAVLGAQAALLALAVACIAAVLYAYSQKQRSAPIAFAPYIAGAIAAAIPLVSVL